MIKISNEDLAWLVGLYEGEGSCICVRGCPWIQIDMTDEDVIRKFHHIVGIGNINGPYQKGKYKPHWSWRLSGGERVQYITCLFWKHLGIRRKIQMSTVLKKWVERGPKNKNKLHCKRGHNFDYIDKRGYRSCQTCNRMMKKINKINEKAKRSQGTSSSNDLEINM